MYVGNPNWSLHLTGCWSHVPPASPAVSPCPPASVSSYKKKDSNQQQQLDQELGQFINSYHIAKIDCNDLYFLLPFTLYISPCQMPSTFSSCVLLSVQCSVLSSQCSVVDSRLCPLFHLVNTFTIISFHCLFSLQVPGHCLLYLYFDYFPFCLFSVLCACFFYVILILVVVHFSFVSFRFAFVV